MRISLLVFILSSLITSTWTYRDHRLRKKGKRCEEVTTTLCQKNVHTGYNSTYFPNHLGHRSQIEAMMELNTFSPLIKIKCSAHLATFLCSLYIPYCYQGFVMYPCKDLCLHAMEGCKPVMERFSFHWNFNCSIYPDSEETKMCLSSNMALPKEGKAKKVMISVGKKQSVSRKGWISGRDGDILNLSCKSGKVIQIRKVRTPSYASCCPAASKAVITAICGFSKSCQVKVSSYTLGAHCKGLVNEIMIRYKCISPDQGKKKPCVD